MPVSFLDLVPKPPSATVTIETMTGPVELALTGVSLRVLADIGKRFPEFAQVLEGGGGSIMRDPDALAALIAAALGHAGDTEYEKHIEKFPSTDVTALALAAVALTFPKADVAPLPTAAEPGAAAAVVVDGLDRTLPTQLSN
jgi:hypothetical protein